MKSNATPKEQREVIECIERYAERELLGGIVEVESIYVLSDPGVDPKMFLATARVVRSRSTLVSVLNRLNDSRRRSFEELIKIYEEHRGTEERLSFTCTSSDVIEHDVDLCYREKRFGPVLD